MVPIVALDLAHPQAYHAHGWPGGASREVPPLIEAVELMLLQQLQYLHWRRKSHLMQKVMQLSNPSKASLLPVLAAAVDVACHMQPALEEHGAMLLHGVPLTHSM